MGRDADLIVVGAGAAGLFCAWTAAGQGARVTLVSARPLAETASYWAQGGMAAALAVDDSPQLHLEDTRTAGRGLVRESAARVLCEEAPARFHDLERAGVRFDADRHGNLALGLEGAHRVRRIVHAGGSATGRRLLRQLSAVVAAEPRIAVHEGERAAFLARDVHGRCVGLRCESGRELRAPATVLATGGTAALWSRTTNPPGSFGSGMMLAREAGAELADVELVQFHPTAVAGIAGREGFCVSEAVRGEGATLRSRAGERFVDELAPRDEVARAIDAQLRASGERAVLLDMRRVDPGRFPNIVGALRDAGHDPLADPVPVAPAAHFAMGGVVSDLHGRSTVAGLYVIGECADTGLHGANRLASNSLSECFVFGRRAALTAVDTLSDAPSGSLLPAPAAPVAPPPSRATREAIWRGAGLVRDADGLRALLDDPHPLARLVAAAALARDESRGAHQRADFPHPDPALDHVHAVWSPSGGRSLERWQ